MRRFLTKEELHLPENEIARRMWGAVPEEICGMPVSNTLYDSIIKHNEFPGKGRIVDLLEDPLMASILKEGDQSWYIHISMIKEVNPEKITIQLTL